ncbi:hypothetical protein HDU76_013057 [Blyttiomyces sp. JEL0837]|nr:hypothetical protein HDU76_013057 [Blyttiomyces sp. JEL0837]
MWAPRPSLDSKVNQNISSQSQQSRPHQHQYDQHHSHSYHQHQHSTHHDHSQSHSYTHSHQPRATATTTTTALSTRFATEFGNVSLDNIRSKLTNCLNRETKGYSARQLRSQKGPYHMQSPINSAPDDIIITASERLGGAQYGPLEGYRRSSDHFEPFDDFYPRVNLFIRPSVNVRIRQPSQHSSIEYNFREQNPTDSNNNLNNNINNINHNTKYTNHVIGLSKTLLLDLFFALNLSRILYLFEALPSRVLAKFLVVILPILTTHSVTYIDHDTWFAKPDLFQTFYSALRMVFAMALCWAAIGSYNSVGASSTAYVVFLVSARVIHGIVLVVVMIWENPSTCCRGMRKKNVGRVDDVQSNASMTLAFRLLVTIPAPTALWTASIAVPPQWIGWREMIWAVASFGEIFLLATTRCLEGYRLHQVPVLSGSTTKSSPPHTPRSWLWRRIKILPQLPFHFKLKPAVIGSLSRWDVPVSMNWDSEVGFRVRRLTALMIFTVTMVAIFPTRRGVGEIDSIISLPFSVGPLSVTILSLVVMFSTERLYQTMQYLPRGLYESDKHGHGLKRSRQESMYERVNIDNVRSSRPYFDDDVPPATLMADDWHRQTLTETEQDSHPIGQMDPSYAILWRVLHIPIHLGIFVAGVGLKLLTQALFDDWSGLAGFSPHGPPSDLAVSQTGITVQQQKRSLQNLGNNVVTDLAENPISSPSTITSPGLIYLQLLLNASVTPVTGATSSFFPPSTPDSPGSPLSFVMFGMNSGRPEFLLVFGLSNIIAFSALASLLRQSYVIRSAYSHSTLQQPDDGIVTASSREDVDVVRQRTSAAFDNDSIPSSNSEACLRSLLVSDKPNPHHRFEGVGEPKARPDDTLNLKGKEKLYWNDETTDNISLSRHKNHLKELHRASLPEILINQSGEDRWDSSSTRPVTNLMQRSSYTLSMPYEAGGHMRKLTLPASLSGYYQNNGGNSAANDWDQYRHRQMSSRTDGLVNSVGEPTRTLTIDSDLRYRAMGPSRRRTHNHTHNNDRTLPSRDTSDSESFKMWKSEEILKSTRMVDSADEESLDADFSEDDVLNYSFGRRRNGNAKGKVQSVGAMNVVKEADDPGFDSRRSSPLKDVIAMGNGKSESVEVFGSSELTSTQTIAEDPSLDPVISPPILATPTTTPLSRHFTSSSKHSIVRKPKTASTIRKKTVAMSAEEVRHTTHEAIERDEIFWREIWGNSVGSASDRHSPQRVPKSTDGGLKAMGSSMNSGSQSLAVSKRPSFGFWRFLISGWSLLFGARTASTLPIHNSRPPSPTRSSMKGDLGKESHGPISIEDNSQWENPYIRNRDASWTLKNPKQTGTTSTGKSKSASFVPGDVMTVDQAEIPTNTKRASTLSPSDHFKSPQAQPQNRQITQPTQSQPQHYQQENPLLPLSATLRRKPNHRLITTFILRILLALWLIAIIPISAWIAPLTANWLGYIGGVVDKWPDGDAGGQGAHQANLVGFWVLVLSCGSILVAAFVEEARAVLVPAVV